MRSKFGEYNINGTIWAIFEQPSEEFPTCNVYHIFKNGAFFAECETGSGAAYIILLQYEV